MSSSLVDIRYSVLADEPYLLKWMKDPNVHQWFNMSSEEDIVSGVNNWIGFSRYRASLTATIDQKPCGIATLFLMPYRKMVHQALLYIVVDPKKEKKGVGTLLVKNVLNLAEKYFHLESVYVEVFEGSKILSILEAFSFETVAYQEKYVKDANGYKARIVLQKRFRS